MISAELDHLFASRLVAASRRRMSEYLRCEEATLGVEADIKEPGSTDRNLDLTLARTYTSPRCSSHPLRRPSPVPLDIEDYDARDDERHETSTCDWIVGPPISLPQRKRSATSRDTVPGSRTVHGVLL